MIEWVIQIHEMMSTKKAQKIQVPLWLWESFPNLWRFPASKLVEYGEHFVLFLLQIKII